MIFFVLVLSDFRSCSLELFDIDRDTDSPRLSHIRPNESNEGDLQGENGRKEEYLGNVQSTA